MSSRSRWLLFSALVVIAAFVYFAPFLSLIIGVVIGIFYLWILVMRKLAK